MARVFIFKGFPCWLKKGKGGEGYRGLRKNLRRNDYEVMTNSQRLQWIIGKLKTGAKQLKSRKREVFFFSFFFVGGLVGKRKRRGENQLKLEVNTLDDWL